MDIREDIRRRTELPKTVKPAEFVRIKKSKSKDLLDPKNFRVSSPKNGHIFEPISSDDYEPVDPEMASEAEIRAAIQEATGGRTITDNDIVNAWNKRQNSPAKKLDILPKQKKKNGKKSTDRTTEPPQSKHYEKNVLMRSLVEKKMAALSVQEEGPSKSSHGKKTVKKNNRNDYALVQHPDDPDFFCLKDTTTDNYEEKENDDFCFSFRGKNTVQTPRQHLLDAVTDDMFVFEKS